MIQYYNESKKPVYIFNEPFKSGGEGSIHRIENRPDSCAKIYHPNQSTKAKEDKIDYLIKHPLLHSSSNKFIICYPTEKLFSKSGKFCGFIMPLAFPQSIELYELATLKINKRLEAHWHKKYDRNTIDGIKNRLKLCVNLSIAIHSLHEIDRYVLVDFKPQNVLITADAKISITDIDSIQISHNGKVLYPAKVATPEYTPKEGEKLNPELSFIPPSWDRFSLAVVIYEILFGLHPYTATSKGQYQHSSTIEEKIKKNLFVHGAKSLYLETIPQPHQLYKRLPEHIKKLFLKAFEDGSQNPDTRPTAEEWGRMIFNEINTNIASKITTTISPTHKTNPNPPVKKNIPNDIRKQNPQPVKPKDITVSRGLIVGCIVIFLIFIFWFASEKKVGIEQYETKTYDNSFGFDTSAAYVTDYDDKPSLEEWQQWFANPNKFDGKINKEVYKKLPSYITDIPKNRLFIKMILETPDPYFDGKDRIQELINFGWDTEGAVDANLSNSTFKESLIESLK